MRLIQRIRGNANDEAPTISTVSGDESLLETQSVQLSNGHDAMGSTRPQIQDGVKDSCSQELLQVACKTPQGVRPLLENAP